MSENISADNLGSSTFKADYNVKRAYASGAMVRGIASKELVIRMAKAGYLSFFGAGGLDLATNESNILAIQKELKNGESWGMNLLSNPYEPDMEMKTVDLYLRHGVKNIEASAFITISAPLVKFRLSGLSKDDEGYPLIQNRIIAKISRPEVAEVFLNPAPQALVTKLLDQGEITPEQAQLAERVPMADDLCVEADSGGHTDMGVSTVLLPAIIRMRDEICRRCEYRTPVRVGAAGGIGTPEAAASAFILGADFIVTGSINQCSVEAGTSDTVKAMLQELNVQDTDYAPAGDMFEIGARVQVMKKGVFFPARANKLHELWRNHNAWEDIDEKTRNQIEKNFFARRFDQVYADTREYFLERNPLEIEKAERDPKHKMALVFRWYFAYSMRLAAAGDPAHKVNYQVHCGKAMGAFNQWVRGTELESWENRHVEKIADKLMTATADLLSQRTQQLLRIDK